MQYTKMSLKLHRTRIELTQGQLAKLLNVNIATYHNWEKYITYPTVPQFIKLAEIFQCSLDDIYFEITKEVK